MGEKNKLNGDIETEGKVQSGDDSDNISLTNTWGKRMQGESTVWKDMIMDLFGSKLSSTAGKVDYDYDENAIVFEPGGSLSNQNDRLGGNQEINHEYKVGTNITFRPHIHWWQQVTSGAVDSIVFSLRWRLQRNGTGQLKTTSWTTITAEAGTSDDVFDHTGESDGLYNQITKFDDITVTCGISDTIQMQMTRTDSETGDVSAYFVDIHAEVDSDGSNDEFTKNY
jgi:hypothetical protein